MAYAEDVLSRAPLFEALDEESALALRAGVVDVRLARGERLFDEGDAGDRLYVILDGKIKLTRTAPDGRENLLSVLGPGEMFGELSLFDPRPRTASAVAVTDSRLAALANDNLRHWLTGRPDVAMHLLRALAQRLRRANDVMADLVFTDVPGRVAKALLEYETLSGDEVKALLRGEPIIRPSADEESPTKKKGRRGSVPTTRGPKGQKPGGLEPEPQPGT